MRISYARDHGFIIDAEQGSITLSDAELQELYGHLNRARSVRGEEFATALDAVSARSTEVAQRIAADPNASWGPSPDALLGLTPPTPAPEETQ